MGLREFAVAFVAVCWVAFCARFYLNHLRVRRERGPEDNAGELRAPASMLGLLLEGIAIGLIFAWRRPLSSAHEASAVVAILMSAASIWFASAAIRHLGRQWRIKAVVTADHELVTAGPYGVVRHPIYLSLMGMAVASGLLLSRTEALLIGMAIYIAGTEIRVRAEDTILLKRFGAEFERYRSRVPAYLPFIR